MTEPQTLVPDTIEPNMPSVLIMGGIGAGKSTALRTLVDAGLEVFLIKTEPSEVLDDLPKEKVHWRYIPPAVIGWDTIIKNAKLINTLSYKALCGIEDMDKTKYHQFIDVLNTCNNFVDDRTGKAYGDVMKFGYDKAFVIDGLTGLSAMSMDMTAGAKPVRDQSIYAVAMANIGDLINMLCVGTKCLFVLIAHVDREPEVESQSPRLMVSTLGQKLAPHIPEPFSDVIHAVRVGDKWTWSTATFGAQLKSRNLPFPKADLAPDFRPLLTTWRNRCLAGQKPALQQK